MKWSLQAVCAAMLCTVHVTGWADWVKDAAKQQEAETIQLRQHLHQHPELGNMELETSKLVQKQLKSYGIEVKSGFAKTGVIGVLKGAKAGPVMALRADMDALPVAEKTNLSYASQVQAVYQGKTSAVMHACGHDTHVAMLLSAAKIMAQHKDQIAGTVVFVFQPAEEGGADIDQFTQSDQVGSRKMISDGALNWVKPEVMFGLHVISGIPTGHLRYKSGAILNSADSLRITVRGQQAHGSMPWAAHDPIVASAHMINQLQTLISRRSDLTQGMGVVSIGQIQAGTAGNIIPEQVSMLGTIRSNSEKIRSTILSSLPDLIAHTAAANQVTAKVEIAQYAPVTVNHQQLTELMAPSWQQVAGDQVQLLENNASASEDFAFYGQLMPSLFVFLGATPADQEMSQAAPNHSPYFQVDNATLKTGVESHIRFVLDYPTVAHQVQHAWNKPS